jgi:GMP synthase (glutamine-hydrolysing)
MKPILIVKTGKTDPEVAARLGDFEDWFARCLQPASAPIKVVCPFSGDVLPAPESLGGAVISGSHDMVTDRLPWSEKTAVWVKQAVEAAVPVLGVCYGHQLLAHALGGRVGDNPRGKEIGTVAIRCSAAASRDPLFDGLPKVFQAQTCHTQSVLELPPGATLLAASEMEPHHAFAAGKRAWGVQFHPEFNAEIMRRYIRLLADELKAQGGDLRRMLDGVRETPRSENLLRRFQQFCAQSGLGNAGQEISALL